MVAHSARGIMLGVCGGAPQRVVSSNSDGPTATAPAAVCFSADGPDDLIATHEMVANY